MSQFNFFSARFQQQSVLNNQTNKTQDVSLQESHLYVISSDLHQAAAGGDVSQVKRLIKEQKADANARDPETLRNVLHAAVERGHSDIVSYLLKSAHVNIEVDAKDREGNTALNLVTQASIPLAKKIAIMELLLLAGADCTEKNNEGRSALRNFIPLRQHVIASHSNLRQGLNSVIAKMKKIINDIAEIKNCSVNFADNGEVVFLNRTPDKTSSLLETSPLHTMPVFAR